MSPLAHVFWFMLFFGSLYFACGFFSAMFREFRGADSRDMAACAILGLWHVALIALAAYLLINGGAS
jgi:hypothetical protein